MTQERNCENCAHADRQAYEYPCNVCEETYDGQPSMWESEDKPQTNAEHIRSMTDEELAKWLCFRFECYGEEDPCPAHAFCKPGHNGLLEWLRQPYKEEEGESK